MDVADLKPTLLLALAIFLASAPNPDSKAIMEMTANFIVPKSERALQASELAAEPTLTPAREARLTAVNSDENQALSPDA